MPPLRLTKTEKVFLTNELMMRFRDTIEMCGPEQIPDMINQVEGKCPYTATTSTPITFRFDVKMVMGDIFQIVGRSRRTRGSK